LFSHETAFLENILRSVD